MTSRNSIIGIYKNIATGSRGRNGLNILCINSAIAALQANIATATNARKHQPGSRKEKAASIDIGSSNIVGCGYFNGTASTFHGSRKQIFCGNSRIGVELDIATVASYRHGIESGCGNATACGSKSNIAAGAFVGDNFTTTQANVACDRILRENIPNGC